MKNESIQIFIYKPCEYEIIHTLLIETKTIEVYRTVTRFREDHMKIIALA